MTLLSAAATGLCLGGSLIVAIGPQNAFILRQGILRRHVLPLVLFCAASDALLILAGVAGLGRLLQSAPHIARLATLAGGAFLFVYGALAFARAFRPHAMLPTDKPDAGLPAALATCAACSWGNPHAYLDTVLLIGTLALPFSGMDRAAYAAGAMAASFCWFFALGYGARLLAPLFQRPASWRVLDGGIGLVMWSIAIWLVTAK